VPRAPVVNFKILPGFRPLLSRSFNMKSCRMIPLRILPDYGLNLKEKI